MAASDQKGTAFDPNAWVETQRRNFEAFASAGEVVADGMRTVAERQAAMVQEAMSELWGEVQRFDTSGGKPAQPTDQMERLRAAFERVTTQVQEISSVLLKAQAQAMEILNRCATANMEQFGKMAPDLASMQKAASDAMQAATSQVSSAIEEMRRRMGELEDETRKTAGGAASRPKAGGGKAG